MTFDGASAAAPVDAIVVGAGVAGLYSIYLLRERGLTVQGPATKLYSLAVRRFASMCNFLKKVIL